MDLRDVCMYEMDIGIMRAMFIFSIEFFTPVFMLSE